MLNNRDKILSTLRQLGLSLDESKVYLVLLGEHVSHLQIARKTGVNRTKVYRIIDTLIARGLVSQETNTDGHKLVANDPSNLEITIATSEERLKMQRDIFAATLPALQSIYKASKQPQSADFIVNTYEGVRGFRQMLWHELKAKGELLVYGSGKIDNLVNSTRWAERHRIKTMEAGYKIREILNPDAEAEQFTKNQEFLEQSYQKRLIDPAILPLGQQMVVYNNTVALYNWQHDQRVGAEIINQAFAETQRASFEHYWRLAS